MLVRENEVQQICLEYNSLRMDKTKLDVVCEALGGNTVLRILRSNAALNSCADVAKLAESLPPSIEEFTVSGVPHTLRAGASTETESRTLAALERLPRLRALELTFHLAASPRLLMLPLESVKMYVILDDEGTAAIEEMLRRGTVRSAVLGVGETGNSANLQRMWRAVATATGLETLTLMMQYSPVAASVWVRSPIDAATDQEIERALCANTRLKRVRIISHISTCWLRRVLTDNRTLEELHVPHDVPSSISPDVAAQEEKDAMAALRESPLRALTLPRIRSADAAAVLFRALSTNTALEELVVTPGGSCDNVGTPLTADVLCAMADMLATNVTLRNLQIEDHSGFGFPIQDDSVAGLQKIADALLINATLITLHLAVPGMNDSHLGIFARAMEVNTTLTDVIIASDEEMHGLNARHISDLTQRNRSLAQCGIGLK